ncbi:MAG: carotene hydroxylase [Candidatus Fluviicola riflensis]|nr:MAG: carotene hydroxylase [Candidatus Fluviicola riflensis]
MFWWGPFVLIAAFCAMEFMAWVTHRFVMHGPMWFFHADHHVEKPGFFERNDVFFLIYAIPSWLCIMLGMMANNYFPVWAGYGIAAYGFAYFMIHDVYIHRRFKWLRDIDHPYFMAIRKAHKVHHKHLGKARGECFGMLIVPRKYYTEAKTVFRRKYSKA